MSRTGAVLIALVAVGAFVPLACGGSDSSSAGGPGGGDDATADTDNTFMPDVGGGDGTGDGTTGDGGVDSSYPCMGCTDFPPSGAPTCAPTALAAPTIAYPPDGVLLPPNMNVLEVQFVPPKGATLFEVDFTNSITSVKVETKCNPVPDVRGGASKGCGVTLPLAAWKDVANTNRDGDPVKVTVRATADGKCVSASETKVELRFAKDDLAGGIYYWQSATFAGIGGTTGGIYSHDFGTLDPTPTPFYTSGATGTCVGCHNLSRDGARMALATDDPDADDEFGDVKTHVLDVATRTVLGGSKMSPGFQTFTHDHAKMIASTFKTSKNAALAVFDGDGATLLKNNLLPTGMLATHPDLSRDDKNLVFVVPGPLPPMTTTSISKEGDHHFLGGALTTATFDVASNTIGTPSAILTPTGTVNYYYPSFSPNGTFLVFNSAPKEDAFYNRNARVQLMHFPAAAGAKPIDLKALNVADGLTNSWPRWSPFVGSYKGKKLLWLTFSSNRDYGLHLGNHGKNPDGSDIDNCYPPESPTATAYGNDPQPIGKTGVGYGNCQQPQIWMAGVVVDEDPSLDATDRSYPAFWLPFQDVNSHNHSAQWVEKVLSPPSMPPTDAAPMCVPSGGACSSGVCCADVVCCPSGTGSTCTPTCIR
ncbi:MAG: hypothetical protein ACXVEF_06620 [Polyangiales bacterium]